MPRPGQLHRLRSQQRQAWTWRPGDRMIQYNGFIVQGVRFVFGEGTQGRSTVCATRMARRRACPSGLDIAQQRLEVRVP